MRDSRSFSTTQRGKRQSVMQKTWSRRKGEVGVERMDGFSKTQNLSPLLFLTANLEEKMGGAQVSALTGTAPAAW